MADSLRRRMMMGQSGGGETDPTLMYLTFEAIESGTFTFSYNELSYSLNGGKTWTSLAAGTASPTISAGKTICWKATSPSIGGNTVGIGTFSSTGTFNVYGNAMSLRDGDNFATATSVDNYNFASLFNGATKLIDASDLILPCMTLPAQAYYQMFRGCTSLTGAPKLPATTLSGQSPYGAMFYGCSSLVFAPELPATSVPQMGYYQMFQNCQKLNYIKCLATSLGTYALYNWVSGVASKGTFIANPNTSWSTGASGIPTNWVRKSSVDYTRLLYSVFDHTCEGSAATAIDTGIKLFDGSLTGYRIEIDAILTEVPTGTYKSYLCCYVSDTGSTMYLAIQGAADEDYCIQFAARPLISGRTLLDVEGDGEYITGYVEGSLSKVRYRFETGVDVISENDYITGTAQPHDGHLLIGRSRDDRYTKIQINTLRVFEIPTP